MLRISMIIFLFCCSCTFSIDGEDEKFISERGKELGLVTVVKPGQIWGFRNDGDNPFQKNPVRMHVVAVKNGYVKYYFIGQESYGEWAAGSESIGRFLVGNKLLIKDVPDRSTTSKINRMTALYIAVEDKRIEQFKNQQGDAFEYYDVIVKLDGIEYKMSLSEFKQRIKTSNLCDHGFCRVE